MKDFTRIFQYAIDKVGKEGGIIIISPYTHLVSKSDGETLEERYE